MGAGVPKQFLEINGKPIIIHTLQLFQYHKMIDKIYVSILKDYVDYMKELVEDYHLSKVVSVIPGGETAQDSIYNALKKRLALTKCGNNADTFIRDTLAPLITPDMDVYGKLEAEVFGNENNGGTTNG